MKPACRFLACIIAFALITPIYLFAQSQERSLDDALKTLASVLTDDLVAGKVTTVAITEFSDPTGAPGGSAGVLGRYIAFAFPSYLSSVAQGRFTLVDRDATARILEEQELQLSSLGDQSGQVTVGRLLNADTLIIGTVEPNGDTALTLAAKAVKVETGVLLGSFAKRVSLSPEVSALAGMETTDPGAAARLNTSAAKPYRLSLNSTGVEKKESRSGDQSWVMASPGEEYQIVLENDTDRRVGVVLLIDGINSIFMKRESPVGAAKWVILPHSRAVIPGWQVDLNTARKFVFAGKSMSLAAQKGVTEEIGLISASFYPEELAPKSEAPQEAGTAAGVAFGSAVKLVNLYFESAPVQVAVLHYDYRPGLASRGIQISE
jgi:Curli production assembly/transport component CsgG